MSGAPQPAGDQPGLVAGSRHGHLWVLRDGTPSHAPLGQLTVAADGRLACHVCGRWFIHLGAHLRRHGWTAAQYREAAGLPLHVPLCSGALSGQIAIRQKRGWDNSQAVRDRFAPGRRLARTGELSRLAAAASRERDESGQTPEAVRVSRAQRLAAGRATMATLREERLGQIVAAAGAADLHTLLRDRYAAGDSLDQLARLTGLGRRRLRTELTAAGAKIRPSGANQSASKRARASQNDARAADRLGVSDISAWLAGQRRAGATLRDLAGRVDRSIPWVRSQLASSAGQDGAARQDSGPAE